MKLSLSKKLIAGFGFISLMTVIIGAIGTISMNLVSNNTGKLVHEVIPTVTNILGVKTELEGIITSQRTLMSTDLSEQEYNSLFASIDTRRKSYGSYFNEYKATVIAGSEKEKMFNDFLTHIKQWRAVSDEFEGYRRAIHDMDLGNPKDLATQIATFRGDHLQAQMDLDNLINHGTEYEGGTTDDKCHLGKWLNETQTKNETLNKCISDTQQTHKQFHEVIKQAKELYASGEKEQAAAKADELHKYVTDINTNIGLLGKEVEKAIELEKNMYHTVLVKSSEKQQVAEQMLQKLVDYELDIADKSGGEATSLSQKASIMIEASVVGIFLVAITIGTILSLGITKPINQIIAELNKNSEQVQDAAGQVANSAQMLAQGATEQAGGLEETSASVHEMTDMIQNNAGISAEASDLAAKAAQVAKSGTTSMQKMNQAINQIQSSSEETSKIIKVIDEIAFQTNLLALNAAVEAARAGESGKGFAVVAEEVRNLAMRSAEAARSTSTMIAESVKNSENGVKISQEVDQNLNEITNTINQVAELIVRINQSGQEQSQNITQISFTMSEMDKVTQSNAASAEESASAAEELSCQAEEMGLVIDRLVGLITGKLQLREKGGKKHYVLGLSDSSFHNIASSRKESSAQLEEQWN